MDKQITERHGDKGEMMTLAEVQDVLELTDEEFESFYGIMLNLIRQNGTYGTQVMFDYLKQELEAGRESVE
jgi:hypothetical protein